MHNVLSQSLNTTLKLSRIIDHVVGSKTGPTILFFGGIHGNESSGVFALSKVFDELHGKKHQIRGNAYAIGGNLPALERGKRYCTVDLNRIWTDERIKALKQHDNQQMNEDEKEQQEIFETVERIVESNSGPFYFIDLHTTSSETIPFVVFSDSMINRKFAENFPLPLILGIEEYLDGALLSYYNSLGYVSIGYEAGHHDDLASYENHIAFIYLCMVFTGILSKKDIDFFHYFEQLSKTAVNSKDVYEILFRFKIQKGDEFSMERGFVNFQKVKKGQLLAVHNGNKIVASHTGRLFMPLYQNQGSEGFFEIRKIPIFILRLSELLRHSRFDKFLVLLPGISRLNGNGQSMKVNLRIARFFTKSFLHLLGYRSKKTDKSHLIIKSVETNSKYKEYKNAYWRTGMGRDTSS